MEAKGEPKGTEEGDFSSISEAQITGITFGLASRNEVCTASINECPVTHATQLSNPFLGLPLEFGRCEACGTSDLSQCEGHFGYIELPVPIYHPSHVSELKRLLSLVCLKCLQPRGSKFPAKAGCLGERLLGACCEDAAQVSIREVKKLDGACTLQLRLLSKSRYHEGFWNFLEKYGYRYSVDHRRTLLPCEALEILKKMPKETQKKLKSKGYCPQDGYILQYLPVPPNCLSVPDVSDGVSVMPSDLSISMLRKVLKQIEIIRSSRSGKPNFESHEVEMNDLQTTVQQYLEVRGTAKAARDVDSRYGVHKESNGSATKAWLAKMKTLFISKGSGFSSRSVITGDAFKKVNEIGLPYEIAQRITFEEKVSNHNMMYLQELVDKKLCLTYKDGASTYSLREGSKGHTFLKPGQIVHRRIMDGDIVFINRPPTIHKHSLQALSVYVHEDHTVKINPLICGPLGADFDGDCIHLFYPQSLAAKAEVVELFSVEKQLLSSHSGNLNLQLTTDALLSLKLMFRRYFFDRPSAQQLAMFVSSELPQPAILKADKFRASWTVLQMLQMALPAGFDCSTDKYLVKKGDILSVTFGRDAKPLMIPSILPSILNEIVTYIIFKVSPMDALNFFNILQPLLMENIYAEGFSVSLEDLSAPKSAIRDIQENISDISPLLYYLTSSQNELVQRQLERDIRSTKDLLLPFILDYSAFGGLIDPKSESAIVKVAQQIGFLGMQLSNKGKYYSKSLFEEMAALYDSKYPFERASYPAGKYGMVRSSFIRGLDPYEAIAHSISAREVIVRSTRGLSEPGTLFKNLMAILRDVVICYDGTVRNICSNSIIQFEYGAGPGSKPESLFPPGEPVGVLAATAMSNPAYKAVLDSSPNSNSSWEQMKEILLCKVNYRNEPIDRRVVLYLNDCGCGRNHCRENAACVVKNHLRKISLKDAAVDFMIECKDQQTFPEGSGMHSGLIGHVHLNEVMLREQNISMLDVQQKCHETLQTFRKKKKFGFLFKRIVISVSEGCYFHHLCPAKKSEIPCLSFSLMDWSEVQLEKTAHVLVNMICPVLLETIIKGDPRIASANIIWISPDTSTKSRNPSREEKGELALDVTLEKPVCKRSGDAWRIVLDCCLPVLHLIDTKRSTPYAVKQIEELLGISCAFDQAVQRLSTSVANVAKGILKEHLILLADTMTCCGNLIGFNNGGIKALSRALGVQVPFTEATLFTPRKCFERASEKSHTDSLSSVVASCSWGKPVAVGTGSKFDIIWGTQEVQLKHEGETDIYGFLHMVRGTKVFTELDTGCLGTDVDHLGNEKAEDDLCLSPEIDGLEKPSFEDSELVEDTSKSGGWESSASWGKKTDMDKSSAGWDSVDLGKKNKSSAEIEDNGWGSFPKPAAQEMDNQNSWGQKSSEKAGSGAQFGSSWDSSPKVSAQETENQNSWGKKSSEKAGSGAQFGSSWDSSPKVSAQEMDNQNSWGQKSSEKAGSGVQFGSSWDSTPKVAAQEMESQNSWGQKSSEKAGSAGSAGSGPQYGSSWDSTPKVSAQEMENRNSWGQKNSEKAGSGAQYGSSWDSTPKVASQEMESQNAWGQKSLEKAGSGAQYGSSWDSSPKVSAQEMEDQNPWGQKSSEKAGSGAQYGSSCDSTPRVSAQEMENQNSWGKKSSEKAGSGAQFETSWDSTPKVSSQEMDNQNSWGKKSSEKAGSDAQFGSSWDSIPKVSAQEMENQNSWGKKSSEKAGSDAQFGSSWDSIPKVAAQEMESQNSWGKKSSEKAGSDAQFGSSWGSIPKVAARGSEEKETWGQQIGTTADANSTEVQGNDSWSSQGKKADDSWKSGWRKNQDGSNKRGQNPEWKINKNRPPRPEMVSQQDPNGPRLFTVTRQRLDMFTSEEQDILSDVEPIMQSIRRIMRLPGYNDADPLPAEDQSYIVDHVLNHHPDKALKIGAGIDHIMVSKHATFQDTRCFFVVSTDGRKEDFSYRKCLENFIKGKYPDLAEEFVGKYFKRRDRDRPIGSQGRGLSVPPEEIGTPDIS